MLDRQKIMLYYLSILALLLIIPMLFINLKWGLVLAIVFKSMIDATWMERSGGFSLIQVVSVLVNLSLFISIFTVEKVKVGLNTIPLRSIWLLYFINIVIGVCLIIFFQSFYDGFIVFMREISGVLAFFVIPLIFSDKRDLRLFLIALALAGVLPLIIGLYQTLGGTGLRVANSEGLVRHVGLYHDSFTTRFYMLQLIFGLFFLIFTDVNKRWIFNVFAVCIIALATIVSFKQYSKSAILTLIIWLIIMLFWRRNVKLTMVVGFFSIIVSVYFMNTIIDEVYQLFHKEIGAMSGEIKMERTFAGRWIGWEEVFAEWKMKSIFFKFIGSGIVATGVHNDYLMILVHHGVLGLLIYIILLMSMFYILFKSFYVYKSIYSALGLMALMMWLIDAIGLVPSAYPGYQWFIMGVLGIAIRNIGEVAVVNKTAFKNNQLLKANLWKE